MVAPRASLLGCSAVLLLLGDRHGRAFGESTCTSVTVSRLGEPLDGTYTNTPSPVYDHYYYRAGGSDTYTIYYLTSSEIWYIQNDDTDYQYANNDLAQHPVDISLEWAKCVGFLCDSEPAILQPAITCEGDTVAPTPSPTPSASDDDSETPTPTAATPNPGGAPIEETPITPTPSEENGDVEGEGEDGGFSTVSIVGIVIGILAVLGGATLAIRFACRDVQCNFFNGWFNRSSSQNAVAQGG